MHGMSGRVVRTMPNRIIKESICISDQIDELGYFGEVFFYRLLVNCDDYGCMDARPKILKAKLFPLKEISLSEIADAIIILARNGLIRTYDVDGKPYLQIVKWSEHQRVRNSVHKYPVPDCAEECGELPQVAASCGEVTQYAARAGAESESESNPIHNPNPNPTRAREDEDDDFHRILEEHNRVLNAAEDAGFQKSKSVQAKLIDLYADHGIDNMLSAIDSCVQHGVANLAYLEAVLTGGQKKRPPWAKKKSDVPAQEYEQRDWTGDQQAAIDAMMNWNPEEDEV